MQMKKILGIFLAVCFFMSVTAAAASEQKTAVQAPGKNTPAFNHNEPAKFKIVWKWVYIKPHFELKKVKKFVGFKHGKPFFKTIIVKVKVPGQWKKISVKIPVKTYNRNIPNRM